MQSLLWGQRFCSIQQGGDPATMKSPSLDPQTSREAKTICPPKQAQIIGTKKEKVQTKVLHVPCSGFPFKKAVNLEGEFLAALIIGRSMLQLPFEAQFKFANLRGSKKLTVQW